MANPDPLTTEWVPVWNLSAPTVVTAHAPTHETGGTDPINDLDASVITSGTFPDSRLSGNVALRNSPNNFSVPQIITNAGVAEFRLIDTSQVADARLFRVLNNSQLFYIQAANDAVSAQQGAVTMDRVGNLKATGSISELNRTVPMGHWQDVPFNAGNFYVSSGSGTWVVGSPSIISNRYTLIGKTMHWIIYLSWFSGSNTLTGTAGQLGMTIPGGFIFGSSNFNISGFTAVMGGAYTEFTLVPAGSNFLGVGPKNVANFTPGAIGMSFSFTFEVQ